MSNLKRSNEDRDRALLLLQFSAFVNGRLEYQDNMQFNNLETVLIQNDVNCLYTYGSLEKGKLSHIAKLLEHLNIKLKVVKRRNSLSSFLIRSAFSNASVEHDLSVLIGEDNLNLHPDILAKPNAMNAASVLLSVPSILSTHSIGVAADIGTLHRTLRDRVVFHARLHAPRQIGAVHAEHLPRRKGSRQGVEVCP